MRAGLWLILALALANKSVLAAEAELNVAGSVPIFCRTDKNEYQPFNRTDYDRLSNSFIRQFGWQHTLVSISPSLGYLSFSDNGSRDSPEYIYYDVEPYGGGMALLHMHVRMKGMQENLSGDQMCWRTFGIINVR